jgi:hypothetical protein
VLSTVKMLVLAERVFSTACPTPDQILQYEGSRRFTAVMAWTGTPFASPISSRRSSQKIARLTKALPCLVVTQFECPLPRLRERIKMRETCNGVRCSVFAKGNMAMT